jgi:2,3-diaminopropionate biosynthesis protein SbnB
LEMGIDWIKLVDVVRKASALIDTSETAQPIKLYLRYRAPENRIIAMPAFVGGDFDRAGIKWIASFPGNISKGKQRASSMTILNDASDGRIIALMNTALISGIRTAAVTGLIIDEYLQYKPKRPMTLGIIGFGPIGKLHLSMCRRLDRLNMKEVLIYDHRQLTDDELKGIDVNVRVVSSWQEVYNNADIFITCTVSGTAYIDLPPPPGSLQNNVSLRDYRPGIKRFINTLIVDDWEEVCRENTDVENMHLEMVLQKSDTISIRDVVVDKALKNIKVNDVIMFNPMGMAIYDIAVASYYYDLALERNRGILVEDDNNQSVDLTKIR